MIVSLQGNLVAASPLVAIVEANGLGYEVHIPVTTAERLPSIGQTVRLHTVAIFREDSQSLYGFATAEERDFFRLLIGHVSGVGPKIALTIMSRLSLPVLREAILSGDIGLLSKCHGIGKKTAERLVVELKDKLGPGNAVEFGGASTDSARQASGETQPSADSATRRVRDATMALLALGYKLGDAEKAARLAATSAGCLATTEQIVKRALAS